MKAEKTNVSKTVDEKNKNGIKILSYGSEVINEKDAEKCNDADLDDYDEAFEYEYYKPNQNYPVKLSGKEIKDISAQVCKHIFGLVSDSDCNLDIEGVNTARAIIVCAAESMKSLFEDFAEDLAEDYWTKEFVKKPKFKEGMVVEFPIDSETGDKKQGVIVEANDDGTYAVFLGHTTLGGLTEPILYDMLGIEPYKKK